MRGKKESIKTVVGHFWFRGAPITTRLVALVVRREDPCLEVLRSMGRIDRGFGCWIVEKGSYLIEMGGKLPSKGIGLQRYDVCYDWPRNLLVVQPYG